MDIPESLLDVYIDWGVSDVIMLLRSGIKWDCDKLFWAPFGKEYVDFTEECDFEFSTNEIQNDGKHYSQFIEDDVKLIDICLIDEAYLICSDLRADSIDPIVYVIDHEAPDEYEEMHFSDFLAKIIKNTP